MKNTEALRIELQVRGCTDEQYIAAATNGLRIAGFTGKVWSVEKTRKGAVVHFEKCEKVG